MPQPATQQHHAQRRAVDGPPARAAGVGHLRFGGHAGACHAAVQARHRHATCRNHSHPPSRVLFLRTVQTLVLVTQQGIETFNILPGMSSVRLARHMSLTVSRFWCVQRACGMGTEQVRGITHALPPTAGYPGTCHQSGSWPSPPGAKAPYCAATCCWKGHRCACPRCSSHPPCRTPASSYAACTRSCSLACCKPGGCRCER